MVFQNDAGQILIKYLGPTIEYLPSYGMIRGFEGTGYHEKLKLLTSQCNDIHDEISEVNVSLVLHEE